MLSGLLRDSSFARDSSVAFFLTVVGAVATFSMHILLARSLSIAAAGGFLVVLAGTNITAVICRLGHDTALVRFISAGVAAQDYTSVNGAYRLATARTLVASCIGSVLWLIGTFVWSIQSGSTEIAATSYVMAFSIPGFCAAVIHSEALRGLRCFWAALLLNPVFIPAVVSLGLLALFPAQSPVLVALAYVLSTSLAGITGRVLWLRQAEQFPDRSAQFDTAQLWSTSLPLMWVSTINMISAWVGTVMLGIANSPDVAFYSMASRAATLASIVLISVSAIAAPRISALYHTGRRVDVETLSVGATLVTVLLAAPYLLAMIAAPQLLMAFFGSNYVAASGLLPILAIGQIINVLTGPVNVVLSMCGFERLVRKAMILGLSLNILTGFLLIPGLGGTGAAIAATSAIAVQNLILYAYCVLRVGVNTLAVRRMFFRTGRTSPFGKIHADS